MFRVQRHFGFWLGLALLACGIGTLVNHTELGRSALTEDAGAMLGFAMTAAGALSGGLGFWHFDESGGLLSIVQMALGAGGSFLGIVTFFAPFLAAIASKGQLVVAIDAGILVLSGCAFIAGSLARRSAAAA